MKEIRCPECGSDYIKHNAFSGLLPVEEQYMYTCGNCNDQFNPKSSIEKALEFAFRFGQIEGDHHKLWVIDQMVRALTDCPIAQETNTDCNGRPYTYAIQAESQEYLDWIKIHNNGEDGPNSYEWEIGIPP